MLMNEHDKTDKELERLFDRALSELPWRRAPPTLAARVFGELARRESLPWWRCSFVHWPRFARATFVLICGALSALAFQGGPWIVAGLASVREVRQIWAFAGTAAELYGSLMRAIPAAWLYDGISAAAVLYVLLFALGATAYRTLYL